MDRFCYITDLHFKKNNIETRKDNYAKSLFKKLAWVLKYCSKRKIKNLIIGGDIFDYPYVSDKIKGSIARMFKKYRVTVYFVIGNHDIVGKNPKKYVDSSLSVYESYDFFKFIGGVSKKNHITEFEHCYLAGYDYKKDLEIPEEINMPEYDYDNGKIKILAIHSMIGRKSIIIKGKKLVQSYKNLTTDADILLTGHYHPGIGIAKLNVLEHITKVANPGSFSRTNSFVAENTVGPALLDIKIKNGKSKLKKVMIPCKKDVFIKREGDAPSFCILKENFRLADALKKMKQNNDFAMTDLGKTLKVMQADDKLFNFEITDDMITQILDKEKIINGETNG